MKKLKFLLLLGLPLLFGEAYGQKFQEPQWSINIYFMDGTGARDTLTVGYDPSADTFSETIDPQFDESWEWIDTTNFNVYLYKYGTGSDIYPTTETIDKDSVRKTNIQSYPIPDCRFGWVHGQYPITLTWDEDKLDSPKLPPNFVDLDPYPRARIDLWYTPGCINEPSCSFICSEPVRPTVILSSYANTTWYVSQCAFEDTLIWNANGNCVPSYGIVHPELYIEPFEDLYWFNIDVNNLKKYDIKIYPIPAYGELIIQKSSNENLLFTIDNIFGKTVLQDFTTSTNTKIDISFLKKGIYFLNINLQTFKIIKL